MRPLSLILEDAERGVASEEGGYLAETMQEIIPFLRMVSVQDRAPSQVILDVMFGCLSRVHSGEAPKDREDLMEWARASLRQRGIDVVPMGLSHAVIRKGNSHG